MILQRSYLKEIAQHLVLVLGGVLVIVSLGAAVRASSTSQGAPIWFPLTLLPLLVGNALPYLVSVTLLVAVIITYGRMAADREEVAMRAAGMHPTRIIQPALLAGVAVAAAIYPFSALVLPEIYSTMRDLSFRLRYAALENVNPSASELHVQGLDLLWNGRDEDGAFRDVTLVRRESRGSAEDRGNMAFLRADRARMYLDRPYLVFYFEGARTFAESEDDEAWSLDRLEEFTISIDLETLGTRTAKDRKPDDYTSLEISTLLERELPPEVSDRFRFAYWRRAAIACSSIPLALLGAMLGWRLRRGGFMAAFAAAFGALFLFFYPFYYLGQALLKAGDLDPFLAAWLPDLALVPVLLVLSRIPRLP